MHKKYEVALSFSGAQREYVRRVAEALRTNNVMLFFDEFEEAELWGKDLTEHLHQVYSESAMYCVMFISKEYMNGMWTTHEKRSAFEKALASSTEYILPVRFDNSKLGGLPSTTAYLDCRSRTPCDLAEIILKKLGKSTKVPLTRPSEKMPPDAQLIVDTLRRLAASYRNGRVPGVALAKALGIPIDHLQEVLGTLYYNNSVEFHSGNRVTLTQ
jgi:hypothetical protein